MKTHTKAIEDILIGLDANGYQRKTVQYDKLFLEQKIEKCKELRNVSSCYDCNYFDQCTLIKKYLIDLKYSTPEEIKE